AEGGAPDHRVDLGALVLQREIGVAGGMRPAIAGDLAAHAHEAVSVLHGALQRRRELGDGPFRDVDARFVHLPLRRMIFSENRFTFFGIMRAGLNTAFSAIPAVPFVAKPDAPYAV